MRFLFLEKKLFFKKFIAIWLGSIFGCLYLLFLWEDIHDFPLEVSSLMYFGFILFFGLITWIGIKLSIKTEILSLNKPRPFFLKTHIIPGILGGIIATICIFLLNKLVLKIPYESITVVENSSIIAKLLSAFYSGFNEEILFRLFLVSLILFLLLKIVKKKSNRTLLIWISIISVSILPVLITFITGDNLTIYRLFIYNTVSGIIFGWLFIRKSFFAAALAHILLELLSNGF